MDFHGHTSCHEKWLFVMLLLVNLINHHCLNFFFIIDFFEYCKNFILEQDTQCRIVTSSLSTFRRYVKKVPNKFLFIRLDREENNRKKFK